MHNNRLGEMVLANFAIASIFSITSATANGGHQMRSLTWVRDTGLLQVVVVVGCYYFGGSVRLCESSISEVGYSGNTLNRVWFFYYIVVVGMPQRAMQPSW